MTQQQALDILKTGENVFLTGVAGSGKTYLLEQFILSLRFRGMKVGITASTGVAATHLSGMTINSWAGIGINSDLEEHDIDELLKRKYLHKRFRDTKVLIIDEVSMLPARTFEAVDRVLRAFKRVSAPFGGMQVVLSGDFFQLPPIQRNSNIEYRNSKQIQKPKSFGNSNFKHSNITSDFGFRASNFIFKSPLWQELDLKICYLNKPFRQDDKRFLSMLDEIRDNNITKETWDTLKTCFLNQKKTDHLPTKLYTHNAHADTVNASELAKLSGVPRVYLMETKGNPSLSFILQKNCLAPQQLILKQGALVMFVKNNSELGYVNGSMGTVIDFDDKGLPIVETYEGRQITARPATWEIEDDGEVVARISQIPLRLAWAITIHKSQGMSLDTAEIDLGKSFIEGLGYVALSRVRTLDGIKLRSINRTALSVKEEVREFDKKLREDSKEVSAELSESYWYKKNNMS